MRRGMLLASVLAVGLTWGGLPWAVAESASITNAKDGSELVKIAAGPFTMGANDGEDGQKPSHQVTLPDYYIGKYTVTNEQFRQYVTATGYRASGDWKARAKVAGEKAPVVEVSWNDAVAYCQWAGLRLPTEAEWEKAARGTDSRMYPWGNTWDVKRCMNSSGTDPAGPVAVGSFPAGASPYGCLDMAGNVWQWRFSKYKPYPYMSNDGREAAGVHEIRVLRGGSWTNFQPGFFTTTGRARFRPDACDVNMGFRVAKTP